MKNRTDIKFRTPDDVLQRAMENIDFETGMSLSQDNGPDKVGFRFCTEDGVMYRVTVEKLRDLYKANA